MKKLIIIFFLFIIELYATPQFAKEQNLNCNACHSSVPTLNDTGKLFLENGFTFSSSEITTLEKFLKNNNSNRYIPATIIVGMNYNTAREDIKPMIKALSAGTISKDLSYFLSLNRMRIKVYGQYKINEKYDKLRFGVLSPFLQSGNIDKISSNSGLKGNNGYSTNPYLTPVQNSYFRNYRGVEYIHLYKNTTLSTSIGRTLNNSTLQKTNTNTSNSPMNDLDPDSASKNQFITQLNTQLATNRYVGIMYDKIPDSTKTNYSILSYYQDIYNNILFNLIYVYKNNKILDDYNGIETTVGYSINDSSNLKFIYNIDQDEYNFNNKGYSMVYSKTIDKIMLKVSLAHRDTSTNSEDILQTSISTYF